MSLGLGTCPGTDDEPRTIINATILESRERDRWTSAAWPSSPARTFMHMSSEVIQRSRNLFSLPSCFLA
ncbi:Dihydroorotase [Clarias magur]|uniref:Dihydroorotase n=1 Tax=Clarias magur TaxID=1594786 RepID=A0A8J4UM77_CLAMG|nr:Dihydroorotase [Clarias magur]